jgi:hypothetical protein
MQFADGRQTVFGQFLSVHPFGHTFSFLACFFLLVFPLSAANAVDMMEMASIPNNIFFILFDFYINKLFA